MTTPSEVGTTSLEHLGLVDQGGCAPAAAGRSWFRWVGALVYSCVVTSLTAGQHRYGQPGRSSRPTITSNTVPAGTPARAAASSWHRLSAAGQHLRSAIVAPGSSTTLTVCAGASPGSVPARGQWPTSSPWLVVPVPPARPQERRSPPATVPGPRGDLMGRTQIYLGDTELELLDRVARATGASRSELIRRAVRNSFGQDTPDEQRQALAETAGALAASWPMAGADYVDTLRGDLDERLRRQGLA